MSTSYKKWTGVLPRHASKEYQEAHKRKEIPFYIKHLDPLHEQTIIGFYVTDGKHYQHFSQTFIVPCERIEKGNTFEKEYQRKLDHYKKELTLAFEEWEKHSKYLTEIVYDKYVMVHNYKKPKKYKIVSEMPKCQTK